MTAEQLERLARLADEAADTLRPRNPSWARTMSAAANAARLAATEQDNADQRARMLAELEEIKAAL